MNKIQNFEIILGKGFDKIKFGMTEDQAVEILGKPDDVETTKHTKTESSRTYFYDDEPFDLTFESEDNFRLSFISILSEKFHIGNKIRIGLSKEQVIDLSKELGFSEPTLESLETEDGSDLELMSFDKESLDLWFAEDSLDEIQIGPLWLDDDTPIWPE